MVVFRRELRSYFATPLAYVFIVIFLVLAAVFTFQVGGLFERGQADLQSFFRWHPWLYLVLIPPFRCASGPRNATAAASSCS
jgi:ABC-2 type transport system permease protein